jgi:hypothetical protein
MPDAYEVHDAQFLQKELNTSAADALLIGGTICPPGRCRTIVAAIAKCSVAETQDYWFSRLYQSVYFAITTPASKTITPAVNRWAPMLLEGMEIKLYPGEYLMAQRAVATAGSTMSIEIMFIETDLQYFVELDKHKVLRRRAEAMQESNPVFGRRAGFGRSSAFVRDIRERPTRE